MSIDQSSKVHINEFADCVRRTLQLYVVLSITKVEGHYSPTGGPKRHSQMYSLHRWSVKLCPSRFFGIFAFSGVRIRTLIEGLMYCHGLN